MGGREGGREGRGGGGREGRGGGGVREGRGRGGVRWEGRGGEVGMAGEVGEKGVRVLAQSHAIIIMHVSDEVWCVFLPTCRTPSTGHHPLKTV